MSLKDSIPENKNILSPLGYKFVISRLPNVVYFCQSVAVPGITLQDIKTGTPFVDLNFAGESINFGNLSLIFKVDEDMENYREIFNWIVGLGFPEKFEQYSALKATERDNGGIRSDASLIITSSTMNENLEIYFRDIFPTSLNNLNFDSRLGDVDYITASVTFSIRDFEVNKMA